jgi:tetratricopeptide (TPR) repeat protein
MGNRIADLAAEADTQLAINSTDGRQAAYRAVIAALELDTQGTHPLRSALFMKLGDVYLQGNDPKTALSAYDDAVRLPGGLGNEQLHLRLGKAQFQIGNFTRAADEFARAYMGGGKGIFDREDPRYFAFLKTKIKPGPNGW